MLQPLVLQHLLRIWALVLIDRKLLAYHVLQLLADELDSRSLISLRELELSLLHTLSTSFL